LVSGAGGSASRCAASVASVRAALMVKLMEDCFNGLAFSCRVICIRLSIEEACCAMADVVQCQMSANQVQVVRVGLSSWKFVTVSISRPNV
jgi:hypothetical protein